MNDVLVLMRRAAADDHEPVRIKKRFQDPVEAKRKVLALRRAGADAFSKGSVVVLVTAIMVEHLVMFDGWQKI